MKDEEIQEKILKSIFGGFNRTRKDDHLTIFLSHSLKDHELVESIASRISESGNVRPVTAEESPEPGTLLKDRVKKLIKQSFMVIAVITEDSKHSDWVNWEIGYSEGIGKSVIPFLEEGVKVTGTLEGIERIRFSRKNPLEALKPIETNIENLLKSEGKNKEMHSGKRENEDIEILGEILKGAMKGISDYYKD